MCEPATLALLGTGLAAQFGSSMVNAGAAQADAAARNRALAQSNVERAAFDRESADITNRQLNRFKESDKQIDDRAQSVADFYKANSEATPAAGVTGGAIPTSASNLTVQEGKKQGDKVGAFNTQQGAALANLRSFSDVLGTAGRGLAQDRADLANIGSFRQGSAAITPLFLDAASHAGDSQRQWGDILGGIGKIATTAGLSGGGKTISGWFKPKPVDVIGTGTGWTY